MRAAVTMLAIVGLFSIAPATAQMESLKVAVELGSVLASEEACGLKYDKLAIEAYIQKNVKADDMGFISSLDTMTRSGKAQMASMSEAQKAAHCAQVKRVAQTYKFIAN